ncbi:MAG: putative metallophosphoesterase [Bacteroidetes bacterium ADurb.Bin174]|nr:MAG: putative metallophosphoesterase [Bacteroidetes bacterium ADurb.Bin174]
MRFLFFVSVISVLFLLVGYTTWRGVQFLAVFGNYQYIFAALAGILFLTLLLNFLVGELLPLSLAQLLSFLGYSYFIFIVYLFFAFLLVDIVLLVNKMIYFIPHVSLFKAVAFGVVIAGVFIAMGIGNYHFNHPKIVQLKIEANKPKQQKSIKIVAVSDLHLGFSNGKKYAQKYVELINEQEPDLVLIAGDMVDRTVKSLLQQSIQEDLKMIQSKDGVYAVLGNHEYFGEGIEQVQQFFEISSIHLLKDENIPIQEDFYIIGRDDRINHNRASLADLMEPLDRTKPVILLDHQPYNLEETINCQIDLQLSGHTHNGQFFPINWFVKKMYENSYGYLKKNNTHIYVTSGLGIWGPQYRIGTQSELVVIEFGY